MGGLKNFDFMTAVSLAESSVKITVSAERETSYQSQHPAE